MDISFEEALKRLEEVVARLEKGNLPLDESLALFQEGMDLVKRCEALLEAAEERIEMLIQEGGGLKRVPFPSGENGEDSSISQ